MDENIEQRGKAISFELDGEEFLISNDMDFLESSSMSYVSTPDICFSEQRYAFATDDPWYGEHARIYILREQQLSALEDGKVISIGPGFGVAFDRDDVGESVIAEDGYRGMGDMYVSESFFDGMEFVEGMIEGTNEWITIFYMLGD